MGLQKQKQKQNKKCCTIHVTSKPQIPQSFWLDFSPLEVMNCEIFKINMQTFMIWLLLSSPTLFLATHSYFPRLSELLHGSSAFFNFQEAVSFACKVLPTHSHLANSSFRRQMGSVPLRSIISSHVAAPASVLPENTETFSGILFH